MDLCQYTDRNGVVDTDGMGDAAADHRNGLLTEDELDAVQQAYSSGQPQPECQSNTGRLALLGAGAVAVAWGASRVLADE